MPKTPRISPTRFLAVGPTHGRLALALVVLGAGLLAASLPAQATATVCNHWWCEKAKSFEERTYYESCDFGVWDLAPTGGGYCIPYQGGYLPQPEACTFAIEPTTDILQPVRNPDYSEGGVSLVNGEVVSSVTDLSVFDPTGDLTFTRTYHSGVDAASNLGYRWRHNWGERIYISNTTSEAACGSIGRWVRADGTQIDFPIDENGVPYTAPNAFDAIRRIDDDNLEIREIGGAVRSFLKGAGGVYRLQTITHGSNTLTLVYNGNTLTTIRSNGVDRLGLQYDGNGRIEKVVNSLDPDNDYVEYEYNACGELERVTRPDTELGEDKSGTPTSATFTPTTEYSYTSVGTCSQTTGPDKHLLTEIQVNQANPLTGGSAALETVVTNVYSLDDDQDDDYAHVVGQCFGDKSCPDRDTADLEYQYVLDPERSTTIVDRRVSGSEILEVHNYDTNALVELIEDAGAGGLQRTTTYEYYEAHGTGVPNGPLKRITHPDGTCEETTYTTVAGSELPLITAWKTKEECAESGTGLPDRITYYTYEPITGQPQTVTTPEAFPDGTVPAAFDPYATYDPDTAPWKAYTTFYDYDVNEDPSVLTQICGDWGVSCPTSSVGNVNGDSNDDANAYGNVVRVRNWVPGDGVRPDGYLTQTFAYASDGTVYRQTNPDGVKVDTWRYVDTDDGEWDWRASHSYALGVANGGPVAKTETVSSTNPSDTLAKYSAWSVKDELIAVQDPQGVRHELTRANNGAVIEMATRCIPMVGSTCDAQNDLLRTTKQSYDLRGRKVRMAVEAPGGGAPLETTWSTYDDLGRLTTQTVDPNPAATPGGTDPATPPSPYLHLLSKTFYDGRGRITKSVSAAGRVTCMTYDTLDRLTAGRARVGWDNGTSTCQAPASGDVETSTTYDAVDRSVISTDGNDTNTYTWYDAYGRPEFVSEGRPPGVYDDPVFAGSAPTLPTESSDVWYSQTSYDDADRPIRQRFFGHRQPSDTPDFMQVSWTEYDTLGRTTMAHIGVSDGYIPSEAFAALTAPTGQISGFSLATTTSSYDAVGRLYQATNATANLVTDIEYDGFGRKKRVLYPANGAYRDQVEAIYDDLGRLARRETTVHDPEGQSFVRVQEARFDGWGRTITSIGDPDDERLIATTEYDALNRPIESRARWLEGDPIVDDPNDRVTQRSYDAAGRVDFVRVRKGTNPDTWATTTNGYDADGRRTELTDSNNQTTEWTYDGIGRPLKMRYPLKLGAHQTVNCIEYDGNSNLKQVEFRNYDGASATNIEWELNYDLQNRLVNRTGSLDGSTPWVFSGTNYQEFKYDDLGQLIKSIDHDPSLDDIVVENSYDSVGRLISENQKRPLPNDEFDDHFVTSVYEADGFRKQLLYPENPSAQRYQLDFTRNATGRLESISGPTDPANPTSTLEVLANYSYLGGQVWQREYPSNGTEMRRYQDGEVGSKLPLFDHADRLLGQRVVEIVNPSNVVTEFRYGYDRVGNLTHEQRRHEPLTSPNYRTRVMNTDLMGRLTEWAEGALGEDPVPVTETTPTSLPQTASDTELWTNLDDVGNWDLHVFGEPGSETTLNYESNGLNEYTKVGNNDFNYDWLGQLRIDNAAGKKFIWDYFGRLSEVQDLSGDTIVTYRYDASNRRVQKHFPVETPEAATDETTWFVYDGWRAIEERAVVNDTEIIRARYGFGIGLDEVLWMDRDVPTTGGNPDPFNGSPSGTIDSRYFLHHDRLGSVVAVTEGTSGTVTERFTYSAYGKVSAWWDGTWTNGSYPGPVDARSKVGLPYLYTGQRFDTESQLYYYKNRPYEPRSGRFLRRDLIGYADGPNLYAYARSNPAAGSDPMGLSVTSAQEIRQMDVQMSLDRHKQGTGPLDPLSWQWALKPPAWLSAKWRNREEAADWAATVVRHGNQGLIYNWADLIALGLGHLIPSTGSSGGPDSIAPWMPPIPMPRPGGIKITVVAPPDPPPIRDRTPSPDEIRVMVMGAVPNGLLYAFADWAWNLADEYLKGTVTAGAFVPVGNFPIAVEGTVGRDPNGKVFVTFGIGLGIGGGFSIQAGGRSRAYKPGEDTEASIGIGPSAFAGYGACAYNGSSEIGYALDADGTRDYEYEKSVFPIKALELLKKNPALGLFVNVGVRGTLYFDDPFSED